MLYVKQWHSCFVYEAVGKVVLCHTTQCLYQHCNRIFMYIIASSSCWSLYVKEGLHFYCDIFNILWFGQ